MDAGTVSIIFYVLSFLTLTLWSVESAMAKGGTRSLLICGVLMAGVAFGLPRAV
jgi:hypothetical protein